MHSHFWIETFFKKKFLSTRSHAFLNSLGMNTDIRGTTNLIKWKDDQVEAEHVIVAYCIGLSYFHAVKLEQRSVFIQTNSFENHIFRSILFESLLLF